MSIFMNDYWMIMIAEWINIMCWGMEEWKGKNDAYVPNIEIWNQNIKIQMGKILWMKNNTTQML